MAPPSALRFTMVRRCFSPVARRDGADHGGDDGGGAGVLGSVAVSVTTLGPTRLASTRELRRHRGSRHASHSPLMTLDARTEEVDVVTILPCYQNRESSAIGAYCCRDHRIYRVSCPLPIQRAYGTTHLFLINARVKASTSIAGRPEAELYPGLAPFWASPGCYAGSWRAF